MTSGAWGPAPSVLLACDYFIRYETGLAQGLSRNGWGPILLGRDHDHAFGGDPGAMRRYLTQRLGPEQPFVRIDGRVRDVGGWTSVHRVRREVKRLRPNVTHVQTCIANDPRIVIAGGLRAHRYALTVHDIARHPGDPPLLWRQRAIIPWLVRNAGVVFVHAERLHEQLLQRKFTEAPVVVVPHGIDDPDSTPLPAAPSLLFFGRISEYKGLAVLLDSLERLWVRRPDVTLTIAGEGPLPDHPGLRDQRVTLLHGHVAEERIPELFGASSIVVLPYIEASQSGVGSLAKSHGRPIIATAVGGLPELVADGSGELVAAGDADALAETLDELLGDPARLEEMRGHALQTVRDRAGWTAVAARTIDAYERYLGRGSPRRRGRD